jgi:hypothetical protein
MTALTVTEADVGTTIANNGVLDSVQFETPSTGDYHDIFSLVDNSIGEVNLFTIHPAIQYITPGVVFPIGTAYVNLTVKDIPAGSSFIVNYT